MHQTRHHRQSIPDEFDRLLPDLSEMLGEWSIVDLRGRESPSPKLRIARGRRLQGSDSLSCRIARSVPVPRLRAPKRSRREAPPTRASRTADGWSQESDRWKLFEGVPRADLFIIPRLRQIDEWRERSESAGAAARWSATSKYRAGTRSLRRRHRASDSLRSS